jgi:hypothetical protein
LLIHSPTFLIAVLLACCASTAVVAEDDVHPFMTDDFYVMAGVYYPKQDLVLSFDASVGSENKEIDFNTQLGVSEHDDVFVFEGVWRYGRKWSLRLQHFQDSRSAGAVLEEDITWGDTTISAGSSIIAGSDFQLTRIFTGRSFDSSLKHDVGVGFGVHWMKTSAFVERDFITSFAETSAVSASGPLPNIGTWYSYSPSEKWFFGTRLDWFEASVGDYAGGLINFSAGVNYQFFDHVGIGLNYQHFRLDADVKDTMWRGHITSQYKGAYLFLSGNW